MSDLPWRDKDIKRGLILFRTSNNAHGDINFSILSERVDNLHPKAKRELANCMRNIAIDLENDAGVVPMEAQANDQS